MAETVARVNIKDVAKDIHVSVKLDGVGLFWARYLLGFLFLRLGSWIVGFGRVKIEE